MRAAGDGHRRSDIQQQRRNTLCLWRDAVLYLGDSFDPDFHRHNAVQCCIALEGTLRIRLKADEPWRPCSSAIIGSNVSHSIANPDGPLCILYLERASLDYRSILDFHGVSSERGVPVDPLLSTPQIPEELRLALLDAMAQPLAPARANPLRRSCLELLNANISEPRSLRLWTRA